MKGSFKSVVTRFRQMPIVALLAASALLVAQHALAQSPSQTTAHAAFEAAFDEFAKTDPIATDWVGVNSPWLQFLAQQFHEALDGQERERSKAAQQLGQCEPVISAEWQGFVRLYPDLQAIMLRADIRASFEKIILPQVSHALRRCRAYAQLIPILEATRRRYGLDETFAVALPRVSVFHPQPIGASRKEETYNKAVVQLYDLGLCERYKPALEDVVWLETQLRTHQLSVDSLDWLGSKLPDVSKAQRDLRAWRDYVVRLEKNSSSGLAAHRSGVERLDPGLAPIQISQFCVKAVVKRDW
ncbi:MAG: hypothetical protein OXR62_07135 [Ahrensia sp.]|nr:hypothetical protein [Ahrensia sp.]